MNANDFMSWGEFHALLKFHASNWTPETLVFETEDAHALWKELVSMTRATELIERLKSGDHPVSHPKHYNRHPSGVECIDITEHMCFNLGNAIKYIWRCDLKADAVEDLKKAAWYIEREIARRAKSLTVNELEAARLAIKEYNLAYERGGEINYPHWAFEILKQHGHA